MGEIADMMLSGELCEGCGGYIDDHAESIPRYCSKKCAADRGALQRPAKKPIPQKVAKVHCSQCGKRVTEAGLADHMRALHPLVNPLVKTETHVAVVKALAELIVITEQHAIFSDTPLAPPGREVVRRARAALAAAGGQP